MRNAISQATTNISTLNQKPPFTSNKKPKLDHGHGKWRGREKYIALGGGRERHGHDDRAR